jgi:hypothetical protein
MLASALRWPQVGTASRWLGNTRVLGNFSFPQNTFADVQRFTANSPSGASGWMTWRKPPGASMVSMLAIGGGGGGGNGAVGAASTAAGGGGGGSGAQASLLVPARAIPTFSSSQLDTGERLASAGIMCTCCDCDGSSCQQHNPAGRRRRWRRQCGGRDCGIAAGTSAGTPAAGGRIFGRTGHFQRLCRTGRSNRRNNRSRHRDCSPCHYWAVRNWRRRRCRTWCVRRGWLRWRRYYWNRLGFADYSRRCRGRSSDHTSRQWVERISACSWTALFLWRHWRRLVTWQRDWRWTCRRQRWRSGDRLWRRRWWGSSDGIRARPRRARGRRSRNYNGLVTC